MNKLHYNFTPMIFSGNMNCFQDIKSNSFNIFLLSIKYEFTI